MRLDSQFYRQDVLALAPQLLGKQLVRVLDNGTRLSLTITEVEAYRGEDDLACHARFGRTPRNAIMYSHGGVVYMFLIYGMHWMLNVVTGSLDFPEAVLIRGAGAFDGPGKLTKGLSLEGSFNGEDLCTSPRLWIEDAPAVECYQTTPRIGIGYAAKQWRDIPWRFTL
jgi:DNA-3-methyladenine glycosylase